MKNKGFTLIELLAVLTILALIALISVPGITGALKKYRNNLYDNQINNIEQAARMWSSDHMLILPNDTTDSVTCVYDQTTNCPAKYNKLVITLGQLQSGGYISSDLKNVKTKKPFSNKMEIVIEKNGNKMEYQVIDTEYFKYEIGDRIIVKVNDNNTEEFYVIEDSNERNRYIKAILVNQNNNKYTWCDIKIQDNSCNIYNYIQTTLSNWTNVEEKRLLSKSEFDNIKETIKNDSNKTWITGDYWIQDTYGTTSAYYVNSSGNLNYDSINNSHYIRPVIRINKTYVRLK